MSEQDFDAGLRGAQLTWRTYKTPKANWDHDHCEFCWAKFMEPGNSDAIFEGYYCETEDTWICLECFDQKKAEYQWKI